MADTTRRLQSIRWRWSFVVVALFATATTALAQAPPCSTGVTAFSGSNSQMGRIFRDAIPSSCPSKAYPGIFNPATPYYYETYTYPNPDASAVCVTVNFDPNPNNDLATDCDTNAHASAYIGSYDPLNQSTNYVGDVGSSITDSFSFDVPAMSNLVLVVTNTAAEEICDYEFEVVNIACTDVNADLSITKEPDVALAQPGTNINYTITVENLGPADATGVSVTDNLPSGLTFVSTTGCAEDPAGVPTCSLGDIVFGGSASYVITATVDMDAPAGIVNTATVSSTSPDPDGANDSATSTLANNVAIPVVSPIGLAVLIGLLAIGGALLLRRRV